MPDAPHTAGTLSEPARIYLAQLEAALTGVDTETAAEILSGVREELVGLDATDAASRLRELGDPAFIAAEARGAIASADVAAEVSAEASTSSEVASAAASDDIKREPLWLSALAALLVAFGGVIIPGIGMLMGYVLVWLSSVWTRRQKWVATLAPTGIVILVGLIATLLGGIASGIEGGAQGNPPISGEQSEPFIGENDFYAPNDGDFESPALNPQLPAGYDLWWSGVLLYAIAQICVGSWLLIVARRTWLKRS